MNQKFWNGAQRGLILCLAAVLAAGCATGAGPDPEPAGFQVLRSAATRDTTSTPAAGEIAQLTAGNTAFALDLYRCLGVKTGNLFFSPHSIVTALGMTYAGARGGTAAEMAEVLHFTLAPERLHAAFNYLDLQLAARDSANDRLELDRVNAVWGQQGFSYLRDFLDLLAVDYGAGLNVLDFISDPEHARTVINDWVAKQTNQRVTGLLPPGALTGLTRLVLTNAMYFKASWAIPFDPQWTVDAAFTRLDGSAVTASMMTLAPGTGEEGESTRGALVDGVAAVELPYAGGRISMVLIVPPPGRFREVEESLDTVRLDGIFAALQYRSLHLVMPRFGCESAFPLRDALSTLGMADAFTTAADFSGMTGARDLLIDNVYHKAFIHVDEAGTEAAAASAVNMGLTSTPDAMELRVDRPFIFLIRDGGTGAILFMGRTLDPAA